MKTDVEIAQEAKMKPITQVAAEIGISEDELELYGKYKAKVTLDTWERLKDRPNGKLILVSAINPTPAGKGKRRTQSGSAMRCGVLGKKRSSRCVNPLSALFRRQGRRGRRRLRAGRSDGRHQSSFHRRHPCGDNCKQPVGSHYRQPYSPRKRTAYRSSPHYLASCDGPQRTSSQKHRARTWRQSQRIPREGGFDITVASELMAILCLASDLEDMKERINRIIVPIPMTTNRSGYPNSKWRVH